MPVAIHVCDETTAGQRTGDLTLEFLTERISVRELIRSRVYQEVKDYNVQAAARPVFSGLVHPEDAERVLNGVRLKTPRTLDWKRQFDVAVESFLRNGFLILVDGQQVAGLDQEIEIRPETQVTFLRLVPLVGG